MKRFGLFFSILFLALALCIVLVGCANQPLAPLEYTIFPYEDVPYDDDKVYIYLYDGVEFTDSNILRTDRIGFESNKKDRNKQVLIKSIDYRGGRVVYVVFSTHNEEQILIAMNQWTNLDIVDYVLPLYHVETEDAEFSTYDIPTKR